MKKTIFLTLTALISIGCGGSAPTQVSNNATVTSSAPKKDEMTVRSHTTENQPPPSQSNSGGMQKPVDVSTMTAAIEKADKEFKAKPTDAKAKEALAVAYFDRAFALSAPNAAQYRAAVGDFRKGLKLKPDDKEAKEMYEQILSIFKSLKREPPKEGEEPPPLPIGK